MSTIEHNHAPTGRFRGREGEVLVSVVIPCLNEAENIEACVASALEVINAHGLIGEVVVADNASEDASAELAEAAGARVIHEPRRGYGSAYMAGFACGARALHRHGRRRPDLRLRRDPELHRAPRSRCRSRDGRPHGSHPARRDAVAAPLRRQPDPQRHPQPLLPDRRARRPLRHARRAPLRPAAARPARHRHGVRVGDGGAGGQGAAGHPPVPDRLPPARRRVEALDLARRLAAPALPARPQPDVPVHHPGDRAARPSGR